VHVSLEEYAARGPTGRSPTGAWVLLSSMEEMKARRVVDALRERGTDADLARVGVFQFGISIKLPDGREATWDSDDTASLEAQVMRNGMLVGYVPEIEGSGDYTDEQIIDAIVRTDYDQPIATRKSTAPPPTPALPIKGGLFRRFMDGFRYK
jgi:hypothetical protein